MTMRKIQNTPPPVVPVLALLRSLWKLDEKTLFGQCLNANVNTEYSRPFSWDFCYRFFYENQTSFLEKTPTPELLDKGALEVSSYLASFGMYRNSVLGKLNRKVYVPILEELFVCLRKNRINPYDLNTQVTEVQLLELIESFKVACDGVLSEACPNCKHHATDLLISKLLMGITGLLPALDRYFVKAAVEFNKAAPKGKNEKLQLSGRLSRNTIATFCLIARDKEALAYMASFFDEPPVVRASIKSDDFASIPYPPMRLLDQFFWSYGLKAK